MIPTRHPEATRWLGAPKGWQPDKDGDCAHLAICDRREPDATPHMESWWEPSPADLALLNAGGRVRLNVVGTGHPPVWLDVVPLPE